MNTLTSVMECVEATPEKSIQFIDSLAREYRLLYDVASKSTIPLSKELELCHSFLEIMRFRKDIDYRLNIRNIDLDSEIPPLVLHTLFENSITHNLYEEGQEVVFDLNMSDDGEKRRITFHAPTTNHSAKTRAAGNGMGLKYVRARLEESYPEAWSLSETQTPSHWVTTIEITKRPKPQ